MNPIIPYDQNLEKVYRCIKYYLGIEVRDVPLKYLDLKKFYLCIRSNTVLDQELYEIPNFVKSYFINQCEIIPGLYKKKEKKVVIKEGNENDYSLILSELIHSKSITQYYKDIENWMCEGLPHFIARILSIKCNIPWSPSEWEKFFNFWNEIYQKYNLRTLKRLIYSQDIQITKKLMKIILNYKKDDILTLPFDIVKNYLDD